MHTPASNHTHVRRSTLIVLFALCSLMQLCSALPFPPPAGHRPIDALTRRLQPIIDAKAAQYNQAGMWLSVQTEENNLSLAAGLSDFASSRAHDFIYIMLNAIASSQAQDCIYMMLNDIASSRAQDCIHMMLSDIASSRAQDCIYMMLNDIASPRAQDCI